MALAHVVNADGYGGVILVLFVYITGLFFCTTLFAGSRLTRNLQIADFRTPILQLVIHWTGVFFAFIKYGNMRLPNGKELFSIPGISAISIIFILPAMAASTYLVIDWRLAAKK